MYKNNDAWLSQGDEPALEPDLPIIDPHHHLWSRPDWIYTLDAFYRDLGQGHNIVKTVFIECSASYRQSGPAHLQPVGETEFVEAMAAESAERHDRDGTPLVAAGIVGFADLTRGDDVQDVLAAHNEASPTRFRGIRHAAGWDKHDDVRNSHTRPPPALFYDDRFREGFRHLAARNLSFEAWLYHHQIQDVTALARAFPEQSIILNHFGGPLGISIYADAREAIFTQWQKDIAELATCPNVVAKLGGLAMPINGFDWHKQDRPPSSAELAAATERYYRHVIDCFGPDRAMFESNFPVDRASVGYGVLWNSFKRLAAPYDVTEKAALFHDTAARIYRL